MLELVTQAEALAHLRIDTADTAWLDIFIPSVSEAVAGWLKDPWRLYEWETDADGLPIEDSSGTPILLEDSAGPIVHGSVKAAVLLELASLYRFREGEGDNDMAGGGRSTGMQGHGYMLNRASTALLQARRKSTVR